VLNKFAIVPEHFILATKVYKEQTHLLEEEDLGATYACLQGWRTRGKELFAFFNSGEYSGASQPHRHIQFLPVESMMEGIKDGEWHPLVDKLTSSPKQGLCIGSPPSKVIDITVDMPFIYFAASIPSSPSPAQLHAVYLSLYKQACCAVDTYLLDHPVEQLKTPTGWVGSSAISYNLGMTDKSLALIPRRAEGLVITPPGREHGENDTVALNGTVLAGTMLVKNEVEWTTLKRDETKLLEVLKAIGIPSLSLAGGKF
jgi:ATP adenylyltransferase